MPVFPATGRPTFRLLKHYLPGPYTFVLEATREVPKLVQTKRKTIGVRIPNHQVILDLVRAFGRPIISTTAAPTAKSRTSIPTRSTRASRDWRWCSTADRAAASRRR